MKVGVCLGLLWMAPWVHRYFTKQNEYLSTVPTDYGVVLLLNYRCVHSFIYNQEKAWRIPTTSCGLGPTIKQIFQCTA